MSTHITAEEHWICDILCMWAGEIAGVWRNAPLALQSPLWKRLVKPCTVKFIISSYAVFDAERGTAEAA